MTTTAVGTMSTSLPGLLLRPVRWPEEARLIVDVNSASRLAGVSREWRRKLLPGGASATRPGAGA